MRHAYLQRLFNILSQYSLKCWDSPPARGIKFGFPMYLASPFSGDTFRAFATSDR